MKLLWFLGPCACYSCYQYRQVTQITLVTVSEKFPDKWKIPVVLSRPFTLSDLNLKLLLEFHKSHGKSVTMTSFRPDGRYGALNISDDDGCSRTYPGARTPSVPANSSSTSPLQKCVRKGHRPFLTLTLFYFLLSHVHTLCLAHSYLC